MRLTKLVKTCQAKHGEFKRIRNYLEKDHKVFAAHWDGEMWTIPYVKKAEFAKLKPIAQSTIATAVSYGNFVRNIGGDKLVISRIIHSARNWFIRQASKKCVGGFNQ